VLDLKTELFKKKQEFESEKNSSGKRLKKTADKVKISDTATGHNGRSARRRRTVQDRARKDEWMLQYKLQLNDPGSARRLAIMQEKAALYDRLARGEYLNGIPFGDITHMVTMNSFE
jgi:hypothetical protein